MTRARALWALTFALAGVLGGCAAVKGSAIDERVRVEFVGESALARSELAEAIAPDLENVERRSSPRSAADDAAYTLTELFRDNGFSQARVSYEVLDSEGEKIDIRLTIEQGPRTRVARVSFPGASRFDRDELLSAIGVDEVGDENDPLWYSERDWERSSAVLEAYYIDRGFAKARVSPPAVTISASAERAEIEVAVQEGPRYVLAEPPTLEGGIDEVNAELDWKTLVGRPFSPRTQQVARSMVGELYERSGYPDVRVEPGAVELGEGGEARFTMTITAGVKTRIGEVRVEGATRTQNSFVRQFFSFGPNSLYDVRKLRESFRRLFATGLFTRVQTRLEPAGAEVRDLVVEVEEAASQELYFEPGLGSYEGPRALAGWRDINLFGSGRALRLEGLLADKAQRALATLTEPRLFGYDLQATLSLFREVRDEPSFDKDEQGVGVSFVRVLTPQARVEAEYRFRQSELTAFDIADPLAQDELDDYDISSVSTGFSWDDRDSIFTPTEGLQARLVVEVADEALGSELSFVRARFTHATFVPISSEATLGLSYRAGVIAPVGGTTSIPLQERFFNGGENTVRSFREDQLGPLDSTGEPLGGEGYNVMSVELRHSLWGALSGAVFYDTGNVEPSARDFLHFDGFRHGVGVGFRYALPIGPLRLDFAANPDPRPGDTDWVTHFSLGMSF